MKLSYYCSSCKKENYLKTKTTNRHDFLLEYGKNEINERCKHCGNHTKRHINRLHAEPNKLILIGGILIAILVTIMLWDLGLVSTLTATIPIAIGFSDKARTSGFNRTMVK
ncbi:hypothetical protein [Flavivirga spongiicola]|uniref:CXXC-20-CXXC protein n=1 Tax=Flavivirga spongiicola TaxID=421621 RepID=A0ABU7XWY4_9FLAO|nr:hypothetical protein [Flavivirga sp. MEBiC05379]MDO5980290.1 hypothetical protein [Flavivirga sp. MEBiC05379]